MLLAPLAPLGAPTHGGPPTALLPDPPSETHGDAASWALLRNSTPAQLQASMHLVLAHKEPVAPLDRALLDLLDSHPLNNAPPRGLHPRHSDTMLSDDATMYSAAMGYECRCGMTMWSGASERIFTAPPEATERPTGDDASKCPPPGTEAAVAGKFMKAMPTTPVCLESSDFCNPCGVAPKNNEITCAPAPSPRARASVSPPLEAHPPRSLRSHVGERR